MQVKRDWPIQYQAVRAEPTWPWHGQVSVERDLFLRSSTYGSAELCPGRVRHANDDGFQGEASEAMFFGTVCHELCGNEAVEGDAVYRTWSQVWEKALALAERDHLDLASKMPSGMESLWCTEALGLLASWRQWWATFRASHPQVTVLLGERPMVAPLTSGGERDLPYRFDDGSRVWLGGTADLIVNLIDRTGKPWNVGFDWKVTGRGWKASKAPGHYQHHFYNHLAQAQYGIEVPHWSYLVANRAKRCWDEHRVISTPAAVDTVMRRTRGLVAMIDSPDGWYTHRDHLNGGRGWWCSPTYCGGWNICPARMLGDDKDNLVAPPSGAWSYTG
jgi:hypothetical protein